MRLRPIVRRLVKGVLREAAVGLFGGSGHAVGPRILCYHGVSEKPPDEWSVTPAQLREQMAIVCGEGSPVSLQPSPVER